MTMLDRKQKIARALKSGNRNDTGHQIAAQMQLLLGGGLDIALEREQPWASITFTGTRHRIIVRPAGDSNSDWSGALSQLREHEFTLRGCFVADVDIAVEENGQSKNGQHALIEVLTIFDAVNTLDEAGR